MLIDVPNFEEPDKVLSTVVEGSHGIFPMGIGTWYGVTFIISSQKDFPLPVSVSGLPAKDRNNNRSYQNEFLKRKQKGKVQWMRK